MFANNLYPIKRTRISPTSATLIGNIFWGNSLEVKRSGLIVADSSDHFPIFCVLNPTPQNVSKNLVSKKRLINDESIHEFSKQLCEVDWNHIYAIDDVNDCYDNFMFIFHSLYDFFSPENVNKTVHECQVKKPRFTNGLLRSIQKKHILYKTYLRNPSQQNKNKYIKFKINLR